MNLRAGTNWFQYALAAVRWNENILTDGVAVLLRAVVLVLLVLRIDVADLALSTTHPVPLRPHARVALRIALCITEYHRTIIRVARSNHVRRDGRQLVISTRPALLSRRSDPEKKRLRSSSPRTHQPTSAATHMCPSFTLGTTRRVSSSSIYTRAHLPILLLLARV